MSPREAADLQRAMAAEVAVLVRRLHEAGVRHRDLSEQNLLVEERDGKRSYVLIDCDTVSFGRGTVGKLRLRNLVQLGHIPEEVHVLAKARFLQLYLGGGRDRAWRSMFEEIDRGILERMARKRRKFARLEIPDPHPRPSRLKGQW